MGLLQPLPLPGPDYDPVYMQQLVRAVQDYIIQNANPGPLVGATLQLLQVPHSGYNLPAGSIWSNNGVALFVETHNGYPGRVTGTTALGTVTVVTHP